MTIIYYNNYILLFNIKQETKEEREKRKNK